MMSFIVKVPEYYKKLQQQALGQETAPSLHFL